MESDWNAAIPLSLSLLAGLICVAIEARDREMKNRTIVRHHRDAITATIRYAAQSPV